jgi:glycine cleavage system T protein
MTEAVEQIAIRKSPLEEMHIRAGASMQECDGWSVPAAYGDVLFEYAAVREGSVGLIDLSPRGRIQVSGSEAVPFLNGLMTNDMKTLEENHWMPAAFPNVQGRIIASIRVVRSKDGFLIDTEAATHERVLNTVARFTLAGDFHVTDLTNETALVSLQGRQAAAMVQSVFGDAVPRIPDTGAAELKWLESEIKLIRASHTSEDGFDLIVNSDQAERLWDALVNAGARPVGLDALEMLRIEAGLPRYNIDIDETTVVTEANLDDAVSYTKGCYLGQEIIARIKYRGHVAKKLTGVMFGQAVRVENDAKIKAPDDKDIGRITSVTYSPRLGRTIALGYVKYDYLASGTTVKVVLGVEEFAVEVTELPFVRGSWYTIS